MSEEKHIERCELCRSIISKRVIVLYRGLIATLSRVYKWLKIRDDGYTFTRKDVKHLFRNENDTARFGDLVMFGGLVFKEGKAHYGLNMKRCEAFFNGGYDIPTKIIKDPISGELSKEDYKTIDQIPGLDTLLDDDGFYIVNYRKR